jgi:hypothetical protein
MNKMFLQYIQEKQKNNFEIISFKNSMRKNSWQKSLSLIENQESPGQQRKRFPLGNVVSRTTEENPQEEPAVEASTDPVNPLNRLSRTTALLSTSAHADAIQAADLERIGKKYGVGGGLSTAPSTASTTSRSQQEPRTDSSERRRITLEFENDFSLHSSGEPQHDHHNFTFEGLNDQGESVKGSMFIPREEGHTDEMHYNAALSRLGSPEGVRGRKIFPTSLRAISTSR